MCFSQPKMPELLLLLRLHRHRHYLRLNELLLRGLHNLLSVVVVLQQLTATRRPVLSMGGGNGGTGVQLSQ